jgi:hypothetical protein
MISGYAGVDRDCGDWKELADRLEGALGVMPEIAGIAGTKG